MAGQEFADVPVQVLGLQKDDIESRKAELKFQRSLQAFGRIHPDIIEARAVVKTSIKNGNGILQVRRIINQGSKRSRSPSVSHPSPAPSKGHPHYRYCGKSND